LAESLTESKFTQVDRNGAPSGEKYFVCYNPPVVNRQLGIRRSYINEARRMAQVFLDRGRQTLVFANNRLATEILVRYLKDQYETSTDRVERIRGYRGGYLPRERREIERQLREGETLGVVSTSALELGVDIGSLDACVLAGYPGSIASTWQRQDGRPAAVGIGDRPGRLSSPGRSITSSGPTTSSRRRPSAPASTPTISRSLSATSSARSSSCPSATASPTGRTRRPSC
jgi:ATP-dependent helicase YprA (DUF1998 family)